MFQVAKTVSSTAAKVRTPTATQVEVKKEEAAVKRQQLVMPGEEMLRSSLCLTVTIVGLCVQALLHLLYVCKFNCS